MKKTLKILAPFLIFLMVSPLRVKGKSHKISRSPANWEMSNHYEVSFLIISNYIKNPKVWGTYKLKKEVAYPVKKSCNGPCKKVVLPGNGNIILGKGKITFLRSPSVENITKLRVKSIPYKKDNKGRYNLLAIKKSFVHLYKRIYSLILKENTTLTKVEFNLIDGLIAPQKASCKKSKNRLNCRQIVTLKIPTSEGSKRIKNRDVAMSPNRDSKKSNESL